MNPDTPVPYLSTFPTELILEILFLSLDPRYEGSKRYGYAHSSDDYPSVLRQRAAVCVRWRDIIFFFLCPRDTIFWNHLEGTTTITWFAV